MGDADWMAGLMRENYEAVGFIPATTIEQRYVALDRYILQTDGRGRRVGYLLHGALVCGRPVSVAQHCVQYDSRLRGHGEQALRVLVGRAERAGATAIMLRCADDLPALDFWRLQGFVLRDIVPGGQARQRQIARLWLPLRLPLFDGLIPGQEPRAKAPGLAVGTGSHRATDNEAGSLAKS